MRLRKLSQNSSSQFSAQLLRVALVLTMAQLLSFAPNVHSQTANCIFCDTFAVPFGYKCLEYTTTTTDGYVLVAHRISNQPRTTSEPSSDSRTAAVAPAPLSSLCVSTVDQPFETIHEFVSELDDTPQQSSKPTGVTSCVHVAPVPLSVSDSVEGNFDVTESDMTIAERLDALKASQAVDTETVGHSKLQGEGIIHYSEVLRKNNRQRLDALNQQSSSANRPRVDHNTNPTALDSPIAAAGTAVTSTHSKSAWRSAPLAPECGQPVLLMHQEFENGNSWFVNTDADSDQLLPFLLLYSGFDLWIGHQRATYYAHGHATLTHDNESYWDWTWDEHAKYDMPALLELVYTESGSTVHFVGISQSAAAGAAAATMPLPSSLLRSLTLIGPTIYRGNTTSHTLTAWASLLPSNTDRNYFDSPLPNGVFNLTTDLFSNRIFNTSLNPIAAADISGPNCCLGSYNLKFDNGWDGTTSRRNMLHYQQGIRTNTWSHFDYGSVEYNSIAYDGMPLPPPYNPEDIPATLPMLMIYGGQDNTAPARGCRIFVSRLTSSGRTISAVFLPAYAHFDLMYSLTRTEDVFIPVLQFLESQRDLQ